MALKIVQYPHPALVHATKPVMRIDKQLNIQVGEMIERMYDAKGLGLAGNQVALPYQILVTNLTGDANQREHERVFFNPVIVDRKGTQDGDEGCLSFPKLFQRVKRAKTVTVRAYDATGNPVELVESDLAARCWQHELDHLNGITFIEKMGPIARLASRGAIKEFEAEFKKAQERGDIPPNAEIEKLLKLLEDEQKG